MLTSVGKLNVDESESRISVDVSRDFILYYNWFISRKYWIKLNTPRHSAHITLHIPKYPQNVKWEVAQRYHQKSIQFQYNENLIRGGWKKGFIMFYAKVVSDEIEDFKRKVNIIDNATFTGLHLTIANSKNGIIEDWPKMISIK